MNQQFNVGVAGYGRMGKDHLARAQDALQYLDLPVGYHILDVKPPECLNGNVSIHRDAGAFLDREYDVLVISLHPHARIDFLAKLLNSARPKVVILEKPLTDGIIGGNSSSDQILLSLQSEFSDITVVHYPELFDPLTYQAVSIINGKFSEFGIPKLWIKGFWSQRSKDREDPLNPENFRETGPIALHEGCHDIVFLLYLLEEAVTRNLMYDFMVYGNRLVLETSIGVDLWHPSGRSIDLAGMSWSVFRERGADAPVVVYNSFTDGKNLKLKTLNCYGFDDRNYTVEIIHQPYELRNIIVTTSDNHGDNKVLVDRSNSMIIADAAKATKQEWKTTFMSDIVEMALAGHVRTNYHLASEGERYCRWALEYQIEQRIRSGVPLSSFTGFPGALHTV